MRKWDDKTKVDQKSADAMQRAFRKKVDLGSGLDSLKKIFSPMSEAKPMTEEDKKKRDE